jgi:hypothetical protein
MSALVAVEPTNHVRGLCSRFVDGWTGVYIRLADARTHAVAWRSPHAPRQLDPLFGFYTNALAALESFGYAAYVAAALVVPDAFPSDEKSLRKIALGSVEKGFERRFGGHELTARLRRLTASDEYDHLARVRNVLSHRVYPATLHGLGEGDVGTLWASGVHFGGDLLLTPESLDAVYSWVVSTVAELVAAMRDWILRCWLVIAKAAGLWPRGLSESHLVAGFGGDPSPAPA